MSRHTLRYAHAPSTSSQVSYSLIALPPALAKAVNERDSSNNVLATLTIKGQPADEAVLCTQDATYNLRAVQSSNSILICEASTSAAGSSMGKAKEVEVRTTLHQTLELDLAIPKLERIGDLLKGQEWSPEEEEEATRQPKVGSLHLLRTR
jgi:sister chromatid cohesion protein DCC1